MTKRYNNTRDIAKLSNQARTGFQSGMYTVDQHEWATLAAVLGLIDFYLCWHIFLLIVGVRVGTALPLSKAIGGVVLTMLVWLSLQALPAFLSSQFAALGIIQPFF